MISYSRQIQICESVMKSIRQTLSRSDDIDIWKKANDIPTNERILRAVSLHPTVDTEEKLKDFIVKHIMGSLHLTMVQKENLDLNREPENLFP